MTPGPLGRAFLDSFVGKPLRSPHERGMEARTPHEFARTLWDRLWVRDSELVRIPARLHASLATTFRA